MWPFLDVETKTCELHLSSFAKKYVSYPYCHDEWFEDCANAEDLGGLLYTHKLSASCEDEHAFQIQIDPFHQQIPLQFRSDFYLTAQNLENMVMLG